MSLFSQFQPSTKTQWKAQAIKDLKGKDFDQTLLWHTPEGFSVQPYYTAEDVGHSCTINKNYLGWLNQESIVVKAEKEANLLAINALQGGAEALCFDLRANSTASLLKVLDKIKLSETPVFFRINKGLRSTIESLQSFIHYQMKGGIVHQTDSLEALTDSYFDELAWAIRATETSPAFRVITVSSTAFHAAGANAVQELAYTLALALHHTDKLTDRGFSVPAIAQKLSFEVEIGTDYFMEMAKIRALRSLWAMLLGAYSQDFTDIPAYIVARTSEVQNTQDNPYTNMLRASTEAMSAVLGGCDVLEVRPYNTLFEEVTPFSARIARNVGIILKEESYLDCSIDPASGSYYLENLTQNLMQEAWTMLQGIENQGGIRNPSRPELRFGAELT